LPSHFGSLPAKQIAVEKRPFSGAAVFWKYLILQPADYGDWLSEMSAL
jgi:hypothetical protein